MPVLTLIAVAITAPAGSVDGVGRMSVTPTRVAAGSTTNLAFTFTADTGALRGQTIVDVARGWSVPQLRNAGGPGYVRLDRGTCATGTRIVRVVDRRILINTSCARDQTYTLAYGPAVAPRLAADGYVFLTQTKPSAAPPVRTTKKKGKKKRIRRPVLKFRALAPKKQPVVFVIGGPVHHLIVSATSIATSGVPFTVTVRGVDVYDNTASNYGGTVTLSSTDPQAVLPGSYHYGPNDVGTHAFAGTIMKTPGTQRVSASDDGGHTGQSGPINVYPFPTF